MAAPPRIGIQYVPSLFHLAVVKTALPLFIDFDIRILETVFTEIREGNPTASSESTQENHEFTYRRAKEWLLGIPAHLRESVMKTVYGLYYAVLQFNADHRFILRFILKKNAFYWRYDGTPDRAKIAQEVVLDKSYDISMRFSLACMYCFEESIQTVHEEMLESFKTSDIEISIPMTQFWFLCLVKKFQGPWIQAILNFFDTPREYIIFTHYFGPPPPLPRFDSFFPLLPTESREMFYDFIVHAHFDDLRFCLYSMTDDEKEKILQIDPQRVLRIYLEWPLQSLFLDIAEKMWNFIDVKTFGNLVDFLLSVKLSHKDFEYGELFEIFWSRSPPHLKKGVREISELSNEVDLYFSKKKRNN